jgi:hypothetical protein
MIVSQGPILKRGYKGRRAMAIALEISFALWIMIGRLAMEAIQLIQ